MSDWLAYSGGKTGPAYVAWTQLIDSQKDVGDLLSASVSTLPPKLAIGDLANFANAPAARYSANKYAELTNDGVLGPNDPAIDGGNGYVYVLAPSSVIGAAPHLMTGYETVQNALFTAGDEAADAVGLPSLGSIENILKVTIGAAVIVAVLGVMHEVNKGTS